MSIMCVFVSFKILGFHFKPLFARKARLLRINARRQAMESARKQLQEQLDRESKAREALLINAWRVSNHSSWQSSGYPTALLRRMTSVYNAAMMNQIGSWLNQLR